jgi:hypothetical protein
MASDHQERPAQQTASEAMIRSIHRLHRKGNTHQEIADRHSITVEVVERVLAGMAP